MGNMSVTITELPEGSLPLRGALCTPTEPSGSAVVVLSGSEGGHRSASFLAREFARDGVTALGLAYFGEEGLPSSLHSIPLEYFATAADWLAAQEGVEPDGVVIFGMSRGSEAALLAAAKFPKLIRGAIATVPGNVVLAGWPDGGAAWTLSGQPLPFVDTYGPDCDDAAAVIPVEDIEGPLFLVSSGADEVWPSGAMAEAVERRLRDRQHPFGCTHLHYEAATHGLGFVAPLTHIAPTLVIEGDPDTEARASVWPQVLAFVHQVRQSAWASHRSEP